MRLPLPFVGCLLALGFAVLLAGCAAPGLEAGRPRASAGAGATAQQSVLLADRHSVAFEGDITYAAAQDLFALLQQNPQVDRVRLQSDGGYLKPALLLANVLQLRGITTYVEGDCLSACTVLFLGGRQRLLAPGGQLGFHRAWQDGEEVDSPVTAASNRDLRRRLLQRGVGVAFADRVIATPGDQLWYPTADELLQAGVVTALLR